VPLALRVCTPASRNWVKELQAPAKSRLLVTSGDQTCLPARRLA
jgi:hypothetical protein